eukprot:160941_1
MHKNKNVKTKTPKEKQNKMDITGYLRQNHSLQPFSMDIMQLIIAFSINLVQHSIFSVESDHILFTNLIQCINFVLNFTITIYSQKQKKKFSYNYCYISKYITKNKKK